jgi:hypothetical protein
MFIKLVDFFKKNSVKNLYTLHLESKPKTSIYALSYPILPPEAEVTSFFDKPSFYHLSPEEQLEMRLTRGRKPSGFGESFHIK